MNPNHFAVLNSNSDKALLKCQSSASVEQNMAVRIHSSCPNIMNDDDMTVVKTRIDHSRDAIVVASRYRQRAKAARWSGETWQHEN